MEQIMNQTDVKVSFYLKKSEADAKGNCPVTVSYTHLARIVGWCAHRNEELNFEGKRIIRPAYKNVLDEVTYVPIKKR